MGFSDEHGIWTKILYVLKGYGAKQNFLKNFRIKVGDCRDWANFWKSCKKLAQWQDEAASLKAYRISLLFLFCNIHAQTGYYTKRSTSLFLQIFLAVVLPKILLKSVNIWPS